MYSIRRVSILLALLLLTPCKSWALDPDSPEVQEIVRKAVLFLSDNRAHPQEYGARALIALAMIKGDVSPDHPRIKQAVESCRVGLRQLKSAPLGEKTVYELCVALIFLAELDSEKYQPEISQMMEVLLSLQKEFGGWGYPEGAHRETGDTSMTQYAVLASWTAARTGAYKLNTKSIVGVCNWLMRTQDTSGGWGYQGKDPGSFDLVSQDNVQHSLSAAGIGSLYICGDLLRLTKGAQSSFKKQSGVPAAFKLVQKTSDSPKGPLTDEVRENIFERSKAAGDNWISSRFQINPIDWPFYYLYALERYQSFKELAESREDKSPKWYNDGVAYLKRTQADDGSWNEDYKVPLDTSFAILFLTRGTKKSIQKAEGFGGRLKGGRGLPSATGDVAVDDNGNIVKTPFQGQAETLLALLESAGSDEDLESLSSGIEIKLSTDPKKRSDELARLRRLVSADEYPIRLAALQAIAQTRDLDEVPTLIFALGDPDRRIVLKARNALRTISRRIEGFGLSDTPSEGAKLDAIGRWKKWYLSIRPNAQFLD